MFRIEHAGHVRGQHHDVFFACDDCPLQMTAEASLLLDLLPAMRDGRDLRAEQLDGRLYANLPHAIAILRGWGKALSAISVTVTSPHSPDVTQAGNRTGLFFSGGLDSFYTLLRHRDEISDLIFVHGLDIPIHDLDRQALVSRQLRQVAAELGLTLIEVRTDARRLWDRALNWSFAHGVALAAIGHMLSPRFSRLYIAASDHSKGLAPWGSHPLLDPLWSSHALEFVHDGVEATRVDKAAYIASSEVAMAHLRVCYRNLAGHYNCGTCRKCLQTMLTLEAVGKLSACRTFPGELSAALLRKTDFSGPALVYTDDALKALAARRADDPLLPLLRRVQAKAILLTAWRSLRKELGRALRMYWQAWRQRR